MILRIVKMSFDPSKVNEFLALFEESRLFIAGFNGCKELRLLKDNDRNNVYFTYSLWDSLDHLEEYRKSGLFNTVWSRTKILFNDKPQAWSMPYE